MKKNKKKKQDMFFLPSFLSFNLTLTLYFWSNFFYTKNNTKKIKRKRKRQPSCLLSNGGRLWFQNSNKTLSVLIGEETYGYALKR